MRYVSASFDRIDLDTHDGSKTEDGIEAGSLALAKYATVFQTELCITREPIKESDLHFN